MPENVAFLSNWRPNWNGTRPMPSPTTGAITAGTDRSLAPMGGRLYVVCYLIRGEARRIISFRKANEREERAYEQAAADR